MADIVYGNQPNCFPITELTLTTSFQLVPMPTGVNIKSGATNVQVLLSVRNAGGTAAGSGFYVAYNQSAAPTYGLFYAGAAIGLYIANNLYVKGITAGDILTGVVLF